MKTSKEIMEASMKFQGNGILDGLFLAQIENNYSENQKPTLAQIRARRENIRKAQAERWG